MIGSVVLRPRSTAECVDLGLALLRAEWAGVLRESLPLFLLVTPVLVGSWYLWSWAALPVSLVGSYLIQVPALRLAAARVSGDKPVLGLRANLSGAGLLGMHGALVGIGVVLSLVMLPVAIWLGGRLVFVPEVVLVEGVRDRVQARVGQLLHRGGGRPYFACLWWVLVLGWAAFAGLFVLQLVGIDLLQLGRLSQDERVLAAALGILAAGPVWAMMRFALYLDLRTRAESLDVFFSLWASGEGEETPS
jgi:hypothetical protein